MPTMPRGWGPSVFIFSLHFPTHFFSQRILFLFRDQRIELFLGMFLPNSLGGLRLISIKDPVTVSVCPSQVLVCLASHMWFFGQPALGLLVLLCLPLQRIRNAPELIPWGSPQPTTDRCGAVNVLFLCLGLGQPWRLITFQSSCGIRLEAAFYPLCLAPSPSPSFCSFSWADFMNPCIGILVSAGNSDGKTQQTWTGGLNGDKGHWIQMIIFLIF